jgi:hypothetical protein
MFKAPSTNKLPNLNITADLEHISPSIDHAPVLDPIQVHAVDAAVASCKGLLPDRGGIHDATRSIYLLGGDYWSWDPQGTQNQKIYILSPLIIGKKLIGVKRGTSW